MFDMLRFVNRFNTRLQILTLNLTAALPTDLCGIYRINNSQARVYKFSGIASQVRRHDVSSPLYHTDIDFPPKGPGHFLDAKRSEKFDH